MLTAFFFLVISSEVYFVSGKPVLHQESEEHQYNSVNNTPAVYNYDKNDAPCGDICRFQRELLKNIRDLESESPFDFALTW